MATSCQILSREAKCIPKSILTHSLTGSHSEPEVRHSVMLKSLGRFIQTLIRRPYVGIGLVLFVLPLTASFAPNDAKEEMAKLWREEHGIWSTCGGALVLLWGAFRAWDEQRQIARESSLESLRTEIAELRLQLAQQKRRYLTADQRAALVTELRESGEPIHVIVVYHHMDEEAEAYAAQFSAALMPARVAGTPIPVDDISVNFEGVAIGTNGSRLPHGAQRLSGALAAAKIARRIEPLTGVRASIATPDYFDLAIGKNK
jgi:hypothetical protein